MRYKEPLKNIHKCLEGHSHSRDVWKIADAITKGHKVDTETKAILCAVKDIKNMKQKEITCNWCCELEKDKIHKCTDCSEKITKDQCSKNKGYCNKHK